MRSTSTTRASSPAPDRWQTSTSPLRIDVVRGGVQLLGDGAAALGRVRDAGSRRTSSRVGQNRSVAAHRGGVAALEQPLHLGHGRRPGSAAKPSSDSASLARIRSPQRGGIRLDRLTTQRIDDEETTRLTP